MLRAQEVDFDDGFALRRDCDIPPSATDRLLLPPSRQIINASPIVRDFAARARRYPFSRRLPLYNAPTLPALLICPARGDIFDLLSRRYSR